MRTPLGVDEHIITLGMLLVPFLVGLLGVVLMNAGNCCSRSELPHERSVATP